MKIYSKPTFDPQADIANEIVAGRVFSGTPPPNQTWLVVSCAFIMEIQASNVSETSLLR